MNRQKEVLDPSKGFRNRNSVFVVAVLRNNMGKCFDSPMKTGTDEFISDRLCYLRNIFWTISFQIREIN